MDRLACAPAPWRTSAPPLLGGAPASGNWAGVINFFGRTLTYNQAMPIRMRGHALLRWS